MAKLPRKLLGLMPRRSQLASFVSAYSRDALKSFVLGEGAILLDSPVPTLSRLVSDLRVTEFQHAATRTFLALKAFEAATGRLPASLDELVPATSKRSLSIRSMEAPSLVGGEEADPLGRRGPHRLGGLGEEKSHTAVHDIHEPTLRIEAAR